MKERRAIASAVAALLATAAGCAWLLWRRNLPPVRAKAVIKDPESSTVIARGAVRSAQAAELTLPAEELEELWSPTHLERLARTYWRFLSRATLGLIRIHYTERERFVVLLFRSLVLLSFRAPEYEMGADRGIVRWRIESGVLVSRKGRSGDGYLEIDVRRHPAEDPTCVVVRCEVEIANFYPAIASGIATWAYLVTQSRIHVIVTHSFLRSLARLDLAESRVGRYAEAPEAPLQVPNTGEGTGPTKARDKRRAGLTG
ncbi:MAG: hypothetical protein ACR2ML_07095 [Solirubrobacteraceae bacterium]